MPHNRQDYSRCHDLFLCTTALASLAGLIIPRLIHLGEGVKFEMATSDIQATEMTSILDTIKNLIPSNPVAAFANGNMLQVLVFAVIVGFTLIAIGEKGTALLKVIDSCNEVCLKVISTVMYFTPIGVFCTIVPVVEANGTETIISLATQLIILYVAFFGFALVIYGAREIHRQRKPCEILQSNASCSSERIRKPVPVQRPFRSVNSVWKTKWAYPTRSQVLPFLLALL